MADSPSGDRSVDSTNGTIEGQRSSFNRGIASGFDARAHGTSSEMREKAVRSAGAHAGDADGRDCVEHARDLVAVARDQAAEARDLALEQRDIAYDQQIASASSAEMIVRATEQRTRAAQSRAEAAEHRAMAARDRQAAAEDRERAARERSRALADREQLERELALTETDALTGARTREAGLIDLDHELDLCRRTGGLLVVASVDVVGVTTINDSEGRAAGAELLRRVAALVKGNLRPYDLVIRLGGDELLCAMTAMTLPDARRRFSSIAAELATGPGGAAIRTGFAEFESDQLAVELIALANSELTRGSAGRARLVADAGP